MSHDYAVSIQEKDMKININIIMCYRSESVFHVISSADEFLPYVYQIFNYQVCKIPSRYLSLTYFCSNVYNKACIQYDFEGSGVILWYVHNKSNNQTKYIAKSWHWTIYYGFVTVSFIQLSDLIFILNHK